MGWEIGWDRVWRRDIGYGVPAVCDHPGCNEEIDRGLSHVCGNEEPYGGEEGCGLYFCTAHGGGSLCQHCASGSDETFDPSPDTMEWVQHKLTDESWQSWRDDNPEWVKEARRRIDGDGE